MPGAGKKRAAAHKKDQSRQVGQAGRSGQAGPAASEGETASQTPASFDGTADPVERVPTKPSDSPLYSGGRALELGASAWTHIDPVSQRHFSYFCPYFAPLSENHGTF